MRLKERLEKLKPDDRIYIAKDHSYGFFFIGSPREWRAAERFQRFDNCEIVEEWKREIFEPGKIIKIDVGDAGGGENGFWFRSEYLEGKKGD